MVLQFVGEYVVAFLLKNPVLTNGVFCFYRKDVFPAAAGRFVEFLLKNPIQIG